MEKPAGESPRTGEEVQSSEPGRTQVGSHKHKNWVGTEMGGVFQTDDANFCYSRGLAFIDQMNLIVDLLDSLGASRWHEW